MGSRGSDLRTKVVALLVSLVALWGFATYVTMRDGLNLLWAARIDARVGQPSESLVDALQHERRLSVKRLGAGRVGATAPSWLADARRGTDAAINRFRQQATRHDLRWSASAILERRINNVLIELDRLDDVRASIDSGDLPRAGASREFGKAINATFLIYSTLSGGNDAELSQYGRTLVTLSLSRELLAQEDTLLTGGYAAGELTASEISQFIQIVGARRHLQSHAAAELPSSGLGLYQAFASSNRYTRLRALEDRILTRVRPDSAIPVLAGDWQAAVSSALDGLRAMVLRATEDLLDKAKPVTMGVLVRLLLAGGLGLLAVIASIIVSITTAKSLLRQLKVLRTMAWQVARERLPDVVERLGRGEKVDVTVEAPPLACGTDEIGQLGQAFNAMQQTALTVAVQQAELRRSVRDVYLSLARRTQAMVHRQLTLLDAMERQDHDPALLEDLFRVDHLAARMRRNAENLIVLSGAIPGRAWRRAVPMIDVLRGAIGEVEDYPRVDVTQLEPVGLTGRAVGDLIHLIAELVENALSFSPPQTSVQITGAKVANGYAIEVEDRGLGMNSEELDTVNAKLAHPPELSLAGAAQLGLYVVSKLAERHGVRVRLKTSPYGGTTAVILIPQTLVVDGTEAEQAGPRALTGSGIGTGGRGRFAGSRLDDAGQAAGPTGPALSDPPATVLGGTTGPALSDPPATVLGGTTGPALSDPPATVLDGTIAGAPEMPSTRRGERSFDVEERGPASTRQRPRPHPATGEPTVEVPVITLPVAGRKPEELKSPYQGFTPSGLPVRIRQASLAAQLVGVDREKKPYPPGGNGTPSGEPGAELPDGDFGRSPEEVRAIMASFQAGTLRGRSAPVEPGPDTACADSGARLAAHQEPDVRAPEPAGPPPT